MDKMTPTSAPPLNPSTTEHPAQATLEVRLNVKSIRDTAAERLKPFVAEKPGQKPAPQQKYVTTDGFVYEIRGEKTRLYVTSAKHNPILQPDQEKILGIFAHKNALPVDSDYLGLLELVAKADEGKDYHERSVAVFDYDALRLMPHGSTYLALKVDPAKIAKGDYGHARLDATGKASDLNASELGLLRMLFKEQLEPYMALLKDHNIKEFGIIVLGKKAVHTKAEELETAFALAGKMNAHPRDATLAEIYCTKSLFWGDDFVKPEAAKPPR